MIRPHYCPVDGAPRASAMCGLHHVKTLPVPSVPTGLLEPFGLVIRPAAHLGWAWAA